MKEYYQNIEKPDDIPAYSPGNLSLTEKTWYEKQKSYICFNNAVFDDDNFSMRIPNEPTTLDLMNASTDKTIALIKGYNDLSQKLVSVSLWIHILLGIFIFFFFHYFINGLGKVLYFEKQKYKGKEWTKYLSETFDISERKALRARKLYDFYLRYPNIKYEFTIYNYK